jgi:hypothetical protein
MRARGGHVVTRWIFLDYLDIRDQSCAGEDAFEQIVTEQRALRHAAGERLLEGVHIVDALADV